MPSVELGAATAPKQLESSSRKQECFLGEKKSVVRKLSSDQDKNFLGILNKCVGGGEQDQSLRSSTYMSGIDHWTKLRESSESFQTIFEEESKNDYKSLRSKKLITFKRLLKVEKMRTPAFPRAFSLGPTGQNCQQFSSLNVDFKDFENEDASTKATDFAIKAMQKAIQNMDQVVEKNHQNGKRTESPNCNCNINPGENRKQCPDVRNHRNLSLSEQGNCRRDSSRRHERDYRSPWPRW